MTRWRVTWWFGFRHCPHCGPSDYTRWFGSVDFVAHLSLLGGARIMVRWRTTWWFGTSHRPHCGPRDYTRWFGVVSSSGPCSCLYSAFGWLYLSWCAVHQALSQRCYIDYGTKASGLCELRSYCFRLSCARAAAGLRGDSFIYESHHVSFAFNFGFCCL